MVVTASPDAGVTYTVWDRSLGIWRGTDLIEAKRQFDNADPQPRVVEREGLRGR